MMVIQFNELILIPQRQRQRPSLILEFEIFMNLDIFSAASAGFVLLV